MKIAIIGSRNIYITNLEDYLPSKITEIISGGAKGVDTCAKEYAIKHNIKLTEFLPNYNQYGNNAPIIRNRLIVNEADKVLAIWDGLSRGTKYTIDYAKECGKVVDVVIIKPE